MHSGVSEEMMTHENGAERRRQRMAGLVDLTRKANGVLPRTLVGYAVYNYGLTKKTAQRYIKELLEYGMLYKKKGKLYARKV